MFDIVGKAWAFIFGTMIIFLGTLTLFSQRSDMISQNYVDSAVEEFVDVSRATGTITRSQYEQFIQKLDHTQNVYDIEIEHYKEKTAPTDTVYDYQTYYDTHSREEIMDAIYDEHTGYTYHMNTGDFIRVTVENSSPTLGRKFLGFLIGRPTTQGGQIYSARGGYVGND
jgi:hypothetical protein